MRQDFEEVAHPGSKAGRGTGKMRGTVRSKGSPRLSWGRSWVPWLSRCGTEGSVQRQDQQIEVPSEGMTWVLGHTEAVCVELAVWRIERLESGPSSPMQGPLLSLKARDWLQDLQTRAAMGLSC